METRRGNPEKLSADSPEIPLTAFRLHHRVPRIVPAPAARDWMSATHEGFATRCLPMLIANQSGWLILNPYPVRLCWDGGVGSSALTVDYLDETIPPDLPVISYFGHGIATWRIPYLFRTPPTHNLLVRGPANLPKKDAYAFEGIVETDWTFATFTMNWQVLAANVPIVFEKDEPICMIVPQAKGELENVHPICKEIADDEHVARGFVAWAEEREAFFYERRPGEWQKDYVRAPEAPAGQHRTRLRLKPFSDQ